MLLTIVYFLTPITCLFYTFTNSSNYFLILPVFYALCVLSQQYDWISHTVFRRIEGSDDRDAKGGLVTFIANIILTVITTVVAIILIIITAITA